MLQQETPDDYVIATGETHAVREFAAAAFAHLGLDYRDYVTIDPALVRPADVELLLGCAAKAERELDWRPRTTFRDLVADMVQADLAACQEGVGQRATLRDGCEARINLRLVHELRLDNFEARQNLGHARKDCTVRHHSFS